MVCVTKIQGRYTSRLSDSAVNSTKKFSFVHHSAIYNTNFIPKPDSVSVKGRLPVTEYFEPEFKQEF